MSAKALKIALGELGQKEILGREHNPRIVEYGEMTGLDFGDDETPWCSIFVNWVAQQAGLPMSNSAAARSWLEVGKSSSWPTPGDVVVFWRGSRDGWQGHVGFFLGYTKSGDSVYCLGGNQTDAVTIQDYPVSKILGFRSLEQTVQLSIPTGFLRRGESNEEVRKLQLVLAELGYSPGTVDGVFGGQTERALKAFQTDENITVDGIYGSESREALLSRMQS